MENGPSKKDGLAAVASSALFCLSVRQPWAWLILHARKDIENRTWSTRFRGHVLIHAGQGMTQREYDNGMQIAGDIHPRSKVPNFRDLQRGGIVGEVEIIDCVEDSESPWWDGPYGFVLRNAQPMPFTPCKGALGFFRVNRQNDRTQRRRDAEPTTETPADSRRSLK